MFKQFQILLLYVVIIIGLSGRSTNAQISNKRLCVNAECSEPISEAVTLLRYNSLDARILSFEPNARATIYSKSAGNRMDLWGAEIKGKRGYVPKTLVRESKMLKPPTMLVDTELSTEEDKKSPPIETTGTAEYEMVEGTKIYLNNNPSIDTNSASITPSATAQTPAQHATALPESSASPKETVDVKDPPQGEEDVDSDENDNDDDDEIDVDDDDIDEEIDADLESSKTSTIDENLQATTESALVDDNLDVPPPQPFDDDIGTTTSSPIVESSKTNNVPTIPSILNSSNNQTSQNLESEPVPTHQNLTASIDNENVSKENQSKIDLNSTEVNEVNPQIAFDGDDKVPPQTEQNSSKFSDKETVLEKDYTNPTQETAKDRTLEDVTPQKVVDDSNSIKPVDKTTSSEGTVEFDSNSTNFSHESVQDPTFKENIEDESNSLKPLDNSTSDQETVEVDSLNSTGSAQETETIVPDTTFNDINLFKKVDDSNFVEPVLDNSKSSQGTVEEDSLNPTNFSEGTVQDQDVSLQNVVDEGISNITDDDLHFSTPSDTSLTLTEEDAVVKEDLSLQQDVIDDSQSAGAVNIQVDDVVPVSTSDSYTFQQTDSIESRNENVDNNAVEDDSSGNYGFLASIYSFFGNFDDDSVKRSSDDAPITDEIKLEEGKNEIIEDVSLLEPSNKVIKVEEGKTEIIEDSSSLEASTKGIDTEEQDMVNNLWSKEQNKEEDKFCDVVKSLSSSNPCNANVIINPDNNSNNNIIMDLLLNINIDILMYLTTTAISVIIFLFGYLALDRSKNEKPLIARINKLEKELLIVIKENQILQEKLSSSTISNNSDSNESIILIDELKQELSEIQNAKSLLEDQVQSLEKELENSTEVGMELNRMLSNILSSNSQQQSELLLKDNFEQLQRQLIEQQTTINTINASLASKDTENYELKLEIEINNKKVIDLQNELDKLLDNILKIEEDKDCQQNILENQILIYQEKLNDANIKSQSIETSLKNEVKLLKTQLDQFVHKYEQKSNELLILRDSIKEIKSLKNNNDLAKAVLDQSEIKGELQVLRDENRKYMEQLQSECDVRESLDEKLQLANDDLMKAKQRYDDSEKLKVEAQTKLDVLSNYFKDKEAQLQKELSKHESMWVERQGEATSTTERIRFMQDELKNYKTQNESLKQEIVAQEVELKSQISMLEKKVHENWVSTRQAERKLDDAKQEAAQLRNRLTLRERAIQEEKAQNNNTNRLDQQNGGDISQYQMMTTDSSPMSPSSLLYGGTKSPPPLLGLPLPPFLPPPLPPGVPFMPPPLHHGTGGGNVPPPFMPPPPTNMYPGDHRLPPLGRLSSPPPPPRIYSPYDRNNSPSPPYDSEYDGRASPLPPPHLMHRGYSPYNDRRGDFIIKRPSNNNNNRTNGGNSRNLGHSSGGSGHSNESLEKIHKRNNNNSKV